MAGRETLFDARPLAEWAHAQQSVAESSVEHNKTAVLVRGCILCGRMDTPTVYRFGRADQSVCADHEACAERTAWLNG
jgi:hypothetical protein